MDYAGLFPPASLSLSESILNFKSYQSLESNWMLGNFIIPAGQLDELRKELEGVVEQKMVPVNLLSGSSTEDLKATADLVKKNTQSTIAITAIETTIAPSTKIKIPKELMELRLPLYLEVPLAESSRNSFSEIARLGLRAKIRTGGVTRDAFPTAENVVRFLSSCIEFRIPFKATAGLHHPINGSFPLTYAPHSELAPMYGHLNLMLATACLLLGGNRDESREILLESNRRSFQFSDVGVSWKDVFLPLDLLSKIRTELFLSFGSCSFIEPANEASQF